MTILGERKNNSATRLHLIFSRLPPQASESAKFIWGRAFEMPDAEVNNATTALKLIRRLMLMANEIERVRVFAISGKWPPRLWEQALLKAEAALMLGNLDAAWSQGRVTPDMMLALDWCSEHMPDEGEIEAIEGQIEEMLRVLADLVKSIMHADLPAALKLELLRLTEEFRDALRNVDISGPISLQRTVIQVSATLNELAPELGRFPDDGSIGKLRSLVERAKQLGPYIVTLGRGMETVAKIADTAHRLLKLGSGEPPAL